MTVQWLSSCLPQDSLCLYLYALFDISIIWWHDADGYHDGLAVPPQGILEKHCQGRVSVRNPHLRFSHQDFLLSQTTSTLKQNHYHCIYFLTFWPSDCLASADITFPRLKLIRILSYEKEWERNCGPSCSMVCKGRRICKTLHCSSCLEWDVCKQKKSW